MVRKELERDITAERRVARFPDLSHPAGSDGRVDLVRAEANTGREGHIG
jgi:hypothetical protein